MTLHQHARFRFEEYLEPLPARFDLGLPEKRGIGIGLAAGIGIDPRGPLARAKMISELGGGVNVHTVHEEPRGWIYDLALAGLNLLGIVPEGPSSLICEIWERFFLSNPEAKFLQICHSKGTVHVKEALRKTEPLKREKIEVVSIAGATFIPQELCPRVVHYVSKRDIVHRIDARSRKSCRSNVVALDPHEKAPLFDHALNSPTYAEAIGRHLANYLALSSRLSHEGL